MSELIWQIPLGLFMFSAAFVVVVIWAMLIAKLIEGIIEKLGLDR